MIVLNILLRIHRKLKEVAVFRYIKKVDKDDGSVSNLFSLAHIFALNVQQIYDLRAQCSEQLSRSR